MERGGAKAILAMLAAGWGAAADAAETVTYRYDALGRLVATSSSSGPTSTLSYDPAGNRTHYGVTTGGGGVWTLVPIGDGSLEEPALQSGWQFGPYAASVSFEGRSGIQHNGSAWAFADAPDGEQTGMLQGLGGAGGSILFALANLTPGATYRVRFWIAKRPMNDVATLRIAFGATFLGAYTPTSIAFTQVTTDSSFIAGASTGTLTFSVEGTQNDTSVAIDAVALERMP